MRLGTISQYSTSLIGIALLEGNSPVIADGDVTVTVTRTLKADGTHDDTVTENAVVATLLSSSGEDMGFYNYALTLLTTEDKGTYTAEWEWQVGTEDRFFEYEFEIVRPQPYFDSLSDMEKQIVDDAYNTVADGFDSNRGGPYLWELPQTTFSFETISRLMVTEAMTTINFSSPKAFIPPFTVGNGSAKPFPAGWHGLLQKATKYHLFRHLAVSYLEIPEPVGVNVAYLDRRAYFQKWNDQAAIEMEELDHMLKMLKREYRFGVKSRSMILAGGIFPVSYLNPARPRWPYVLSRFY